MLHRSRRATPTASATGRAGPTTALAPATSAASATGCRGPNTALATAVWGLSGHSYGASGSAHLV